MTAGYVGGGHHARLLFALLGTLFAQHALASTSPTLDDVRAQGSLACAVVVEQEDFNKTDTHGDLSPLGSAICRAVAAAVLGDPGKVVLQGYPDDAHAVAALSSSKAALLVGTTPEATHAMLDHLSFSPVLFYDGQGFLVRRTLNIRDPAGLARKTVCYLSETPADTALVEWSVRARVAIRPHPFEEGGEMEAALTSGNCDAIADSVSSMAGMRAGFHGERNAFEILPEMITLDPFAAATRQRDPVWSTIVSDVVTVLIEAEQDGIGLHTLAQAGRSQDPSISRLLGPTPGLVTLLGLQNGWAGRAIAASGNYGEILSATTGLRSPLDLPRGVNRLWNKGGLIAAPEFP